MNSAAESNMDLSVISPDLNDVINVPVISPENSLITNKAGKLFERIKNEYFERWQDPITGVIFTRFDLFNEEIYVKALQEVNSILSEYGFVQHVTKKNIGEFNYYHSVTIFSSIKAFPKGKAQKMTDSLKAPEGMNQRTAVVIDVGAISPLIHTLMQLSKSNMNKYKHDVSYFLQNGYMNGTGAPFLTWLLLGSNDEMKKFIKARYADVLNKSEK